MNKKIAIASILWSVLFFSFGVYLTKNNSLTLGIFNIVLHGANILFNLWCFSEFYSRKGLGYFRVFGIGIHWKDTSRHRMFFSERNGFRKNSVKIRSWRFSYISNNQKTNKS